jgi:hypothetical protein
MRAFDCTYIRKKLIFGKSVGGFLRLTRLYRVKFTTFLYLLAFCQNLSVPGKKYTNRMLSLYSTIVWFFKFSTVVSGQIYHFFVCPTMLSKLKYYTAKYYISTTRHCFLEVSPQRPQRLLTNIQIYT